ncbi:hypothetical protein AB0D35_17600 [Streptomyces sp. NPDC048301]|uniref:hypothetical protein n=1 Tax=Streptomyces sp. NPDC048301 TaxID=3155631 RepID=UPI003412DDA7
MGKRSSWARYSSVVIGILAFVFGLSALLTDQSAVAKWVVSGVCMVTGASLFAVSYVLDSRDVRHGGPARSAGAGERDRDRDRDPRVRPSQERSASDDAFLKSKIGRTYPPRHREEPQRETQARGPVTVLNSKQDTELGVTESGIVVRDNWPRPGGASRWKVRLHLRWEDIAHLGFDYGTHDSVVSLWAVPSRGARRQHIVDSGAFTSTQWQDLAHGVAALTGGRLTVDLAGRDHPGMPRDS